MTGDGRRGMVVEESGNMIILCDAIAQAEGNPDFSARGGRSSRNGRSTSSNTVSIPKNQLCTDDFMGHLAHNANLSVKAIVALAAYGDLCAAPRRYRHREKLFRPRQGRCAPLDEGRR